MSASYQSVQSLFRRCLAVIYGIAFASLAVQITGLVGAQGILPAQKFLSQIGAGSGFERFLLVPTVFWISASDAVLTMSCWLGVALAAVLAAGYLERWMLALLLVLYLSFSTIGQEFLGYQWDALLIETGFLAIFFGRSQMIVWLFRLLLFRVYFLSGAVKLASGDQTWRHLTALDFHYYTQPLPTPLAWYAAQLPQWFQRTSTFCVLAIELGVPFAIFAPRPIRMAGAWCMIALQILILLTGNYTFFNLLAIALCLFLFDDRTLARILRRKAQTAPAVDSRYRKWLVTAGASVLFLLGVVRLWEGLGRVPPEPLRSLGRVAAPFEIVNTYGLFAVMTTTRTEIVIEGSEDGNEWRRYEFRDKPGPLNRAPPWVEPHQPRLDWQMWFAALGDYQNNPWFVNFAVRLLEGSPPVLRLLERNPFPSHPPRFLRALAFEYKFTDWDTRRRTGDWWQRTPRGLYLPVITLRMREAG